MRVTITDKRASIMMRLTSITSTEVLKAAVHLKESWNFHPFKERCVCDYHLPYKWQVLDQNGKTWKDLPNGEEIERAFCNPANEVSPGPETVNFISMTCGGRKVCRLSTVLSICKPSTFILTTEWLWYWKNGEEEWIEYEKRGTPFTSQILETIYQSDPESELSVSSGTDTYKLYLKDMYQQNVLYQTKRDIRRRPRFVSALEIESKLKSETSSFSVAIPAQWDRRALPSFSYQLVPLSRTNADFIMVEKLFKQTMPTFKINRIERNQNCSLWKVFQWQKEQMRERNLERDVDERFLFHGTQESLIETICEQNFDWRICGVNGTVYGKGSYFARDASYSHRYSQSDVTTNKMFVVRILVGHYTKGYPTFVRPPLKTVGKGFYDSCVNNCSDPTIFVIFEKYQIYPEFIIEYASEKSRCLIS